MNNLKKETEKFNEVKVEIRGDQYEIFNNDQFEKMDKKTILKYYPEHKNCSEIYKGWLSPETYLVFIYENRYEIEKVEIETRKNRTKLKEKLEKDWKVINNNDLGMKNFYELPHTQRWYNREKIKRRDLLILSKTKKEFGKTKIKFLIFDNKYGFEYECENSNPIQERSEKIEERVEELEKLASTL